ncbi:MAG: hypothetical protein HOP20_02930 [Sulfuriferula sp.]|nr:hypothetical protein [Sulfuriferula sp.]
MTYFVYYSAAGTKVARQQGRHIVPLDNMDVTQIPADVPVRLLIDGVDEDYQRLTVPHVTGSARQHLLARHLGGLAATYKLAQWQARLTHGRRDDVYLLAAIHDSDNLAACVQALQHTQIVGIHSTAMLVWQMARRVDKSVTALWITQGLGGTRLTYLANGCLLFTRLLDSDADVAAEIAHTQQYLISHQLLDAAQSLMVHDNRALDYLVQCRAGLPNFAPPWMLRHARWRQIARWWRASMWVISVLGLAAGGYFYQQHQQLLRYRLALPHTPLVAVQTMQIADKQAALALYQQLRHAPQLPADLAWLSNILTVYPHLQIQQLTWRQASGGVLVLAGAVQGLDTLAAMTEVDGFTAHLRRDKRVLQVQVAQLPINRDPQLAVHGGVMPTSAKFALQVDLRGVP